MIISESKAIYGVWGLLGGAVVGGIVCVMVNFALSEVSTSPAFAILFGLSLIVIGCLIIIRVHFTKPSTSQHSGARKWSRFGVQCFAMVVCMAGVACFLLERDWARFLTPRGKLPLYAILGVALWFAMTFALLDIIQMLVRLISSVCNETLHSGDSFLTFSSSSQVGMTLLATLLLGLYSGVVFALLDVEDDSLDNGWRGHRADIMYTLPVGVLTCAIVGAAHQSCFNSIAEHGYDYLYVPVKQDAT